jgi:hypothetical protein
MERLPFWLALAAFTANMATPCALRFVPEAFQSSAFGSNGGDEAGLAVAVDPLGNVYVAGTTSAEDEDRFGEVLVQTVRDTDAADQAAGQAADVLFVSAGEASGGEAGPDTGRGRGREASAANDVFVAKFTADGETAWVRRFGSDRADKVTSMAYRHGVVYVGGSTFGSADAKDTPEGTSDLFAMAFKEDGRPEWSHPLQIGSGGNDSIQAIALNADAGRGATVCPYLYVAGRVGGDLFRRAEQMMKSEDDCACQTGSSAAAAGTTTRSSSGGVANKTTNPGRGLRVDLPAPEGAKTPPPEELTDSSDMFVAKITLDGTIVDAVQLPLQFDNSADAVTAMGGKLYVSVNSYGGDPFDPSGSSSLVVMCAEDLSYRTVYADRNFSHAGDYMQSMAMDSTGNVFLAGVTATESGPGVHYLVRKYSAAKKQYAWETRVGTSQGPMRPARVNIAVGRVTNQLFVAGHERGFYTAERDEAEDERAGDDFARLIAERELSPGDETAALPQRGLIRTGLTVLSSRFGEEVSSWDKLVPFPIEYEDMQSVALDEQENLVFTGRRLNGQSHEWDACVGSFGSQDFSATSRADLEKDTGGGESGALGTGAVVRKGQEMGALVIGLIVMAASISAISVLTVAFMTRTWMMSRVQVMDPSGGYLYEYRTGELSKFEQNAQQKYYMHEHDNDELIFPGAGLDFARSLSGGSSIVRRAISRQASGSSNAPGGSARPM